MPAIKQKIFNISVQRLLREIKETTIKEKRRPVLCSWIVNTSSPNRSLQSNPNRILNRTFVKIYILVSKFTWKHKGPRIAKTILKKTIWKLFFSLRKINIIKAVWLFVSSTSK